MPFDYGAYQAKCNNLSTEQLQKEWENYTRQIAGGATSTATSVLLSPATAGISLIGLGLSAPRIHNARKKREIIEAGLKARGTTHNTRKRDVVAPMAISGVLAGATFGLAGTGADIIAGEAVGKGAEYAASHAILDVAGATIEHKHDEHLKKKGEQKLQAQYQNFQVQYAQQQAGFQGVQPQFTGYQQVMPAQGNPQAYQMAYIAYQGPQMAGQQTFVQSTQAVQYRQVQPPVQYQQVPQPVQYQQAQQPVKYEYVPVPAPQQNLPNQAPQSLANQYQTVPQPDTMPPPQYQQHQQQPVPQMQSQPIPQEQQQQQQGSIAYASIQTQINVGSTSTPPPPPTAADMSSYYPPEKTPAYTTSLGGNPNVAHESSNTPVPQSTFVPTPTPPVVDQSNHSSPPLPPSFIQELPGDYFGASDAVTVEVEEVEEALASLTMEEEILLLKARLLQMELEKRRADAAKPAPNEPDNLDTSQNHSNLNPTCESAPQSPLEANSAEQHQLREHAPPPVPTTHPASPPPPETSGPEIHSKPQAPHRQSTAFTWNIEAEVVIQVDNNEQHQLNSHAPPPIGKLHPEDAAAPPVEPSNQQSAQDPPGPSQAFIWNTESPFQPPSDQPDSSQQHQYDHHAPPPNKNDNAHAASSETNKPESHTDTETPHKPSPASAWESETSSQFPAQTHQYWPHAPPPETHGYQSDQPAGQGAHETYNAQHEQVPSQIPSLNTQHSTQRLPVRQNTNQTHQYAPYVPPPVAEEHSHEQHKPNNPPSATTTTTFTGHFASETHRYSAYSPPVESVSQPNHSSTAQQKPPSPTPIVTHLFSSAPPPKRDSPPIVTALLANAPQTQNPSTTTTFAPTPAPIATAASPPPAQQYQQTQTPPITTNFAPTPAPLATTASPPPVSPYQQTQAPPVFTTPQYAPQQNFQQQNNQQTTIQQTNIQQTNIQQTNIQQQNAPQQPIPQQSILQQNTQQAPAHNGAPIYYQQQQNAQNYAPAPSATPAPYLVSPMSSPMPQYSSLNQPPPSPCVSPQPLPGQSSYQPYNYPKPPTQRQDSGYFSQYTASLHPTRTNSSISSLSSIMSPSAMSPQTPAQHYRQGSIQFQQPGLTMSPAPMTPHPTGQMYFPPPPPSPAPGTTKRFFAQTPAPQQQYQPAPQAQYQPMPNSGYGQPVAVQQVQELQWAPHMANTNPVEPNYGPPPPVPQAWKG